MLGGVYSLIRVVQFIALRLQIIFIIILGLELILELVQQRHQFLAEEIVIIDANLHVIIRQILQIILLCWTRISEENLLEIVAPYIQFVHFLVMTHNVIMLLREVVDQA